MGETESSIQRGGIVASRFQPQCFHQIQRTLLRKRIYCLCCSHLAILADSSDGSLELLSFLLGYHYFEHLLGFICLQKHKVAIKREEAVNREISKKMAEDKKMNKKEKDE